MIFRSDFPQCHIFWQCFGSKYSPHHPEPPRKFEWIILAITNFSYRFLHCLFQHWTVQRSGKTLNILWMGIPISWEQHNQDTGHCSLLVSISSWSWDLQHQDPWVFTIYLAETKYRKETWKLNKQGNQKERKDEHTNASHFCSKGFSPFMWSSNSS